MASLNGRLQEAMGSRKMGGLPKAKGPTMSARVAGKTAVAKTPSKRGKLIDAVAKGVATGAAGTKAGRAAEMPMKPSHGGNKGGVAKAVQKQKVADIARKARL